MKKVKFLTTDTKNVPLNEFEDQIKTEIEMIKMFAKTSNPLVDIKIVAHEKREVVPD
ncbi:hypothetical protein HP567_012965 [Brevibacillus sp. M2.1A]|uniref:hypothetical protein n=1 Tax=Brevibacillus sp. M2.1A TaxID=2738980 RepID=UPI00156AE17E|nr:hypothetical protein [Brevibacillus sp. M2.1A]MCC8435456.1 hypothetical protein [Brevibacillus sp. M2.1A]